MAGARRPHSNRLVRWSGKRDELSESSRASKRLAAQFELASERELVFVVGIYRRLVHLCANAEQMNES